MLASTESTASKSLNAQLQQEWRLVTLFLFVLTILLSTYRSDIGLSRLDNTFYDFTLAIAPPQPAPPEIALIAIDDGSIAELGYWPWRRSTHAKLLERLEGARAIGLDMVFQEANPAYPIDDLTLAAAIGENGVVVLPQIYHAQTNRIAQPLTELREQAAALGYINIYPDADGVVRKVKLRHLLPNGEEILHFAPTMLKVGQDDQALRPIMADGNDQTRYIPYAGRPGHFNTYSYHSVLHGNYPPDFFKDKYVLIGAWSSGLGDTFSTPMSKAEQATMSGMEILANILLSSERNQWIDIPPKWLSALLSFIPVFLVCLVLLKQSPRQAFLTLTFVVISIFLVNWLAMHVFGIWVPPATSLFVTILTYPLWHWRSQEAALRQVSQNLEKLQRDYPEIKAAMQSSHSDQQARSLPQRLSLLHKSIDLLRRAQTRREETLRFISHDMRAPQNSLLALSALQKDAAHKMSSEQLLEHVDIYATQTLELVDNFMNLARAEAMDMVLEPLNVADLLADSMDHAWAAASRKKVDLHYACTSEAWAMGNAPMLRRVFTNLIENAIKYGPEHNAISAHFTVTEMSVVLQLSDKGWGIAAEHLPHLFEPYHRAHTEQSDTPSGSGLGLAFVKTVISRHNGDISVESELGVGSVFSIRLDAAPTPE